MKKGIIEPPDTNKDIVEYNNKGHTIYYSVECKEATTIYIQFYNKRKDGKYITNGKKVPGAFLDFLWIDVFDLAKPGELGNYNWWKVTDILQDQDGEIFKSTWLMWRLKSL